MKLKLKYPLEDYIGLEMFAGDPMCSTPSPCKMIVRDDMGHECILCHMIIPPGALCLREEGYDECGPYRCYDCIDCCNELIQEGLDTDGEVMEQE